MRNLIICLITFTFVGCASHKIRDISYLPSDLKTQKKEPKLNIFLPYDKQTKKLSVVIFVHGGNWNSGDKDTYVLMGRNFAKKGIIAIIPDYTLSPDADYDQMTRQVAAAIIWTRDNAFRYEIDPKQIYVSGHSAGGHLAALAVMNPKYGIPDGTVAGLILNDAAGLDMKQHLEFDPPTDSHDYLATWGNDPEKWHDASPIYFIGKQTPPILMYTGKNTFEMIRKGNQRFLDELRKFQPDVQPIIIKKNHFSMVIQYFFGRSRRYPEALDFIAKNAPKGS
ncbi:MAG: alpha/beta hydrolase [Flavobacterium sp.]|uniref:alpha/beta hydrolase n=1 Tax=Flavobacterium sp. TaxID=239 RepID=UPI00121A5E5D|nr:alpha/beta hydrolase [Flavobacterium sp.]RZJ67635.1 MAG: alpha/beta hydrolase [Flavobacterium sp.]